MRQHLGDSYAESYAQDQVLGALGGRTPQQALDEGEETKLVWRAVWAELRLPDSER
jgi:hypothetical protein